MSHRLTKEEQDEQFELFLKESVSDDSVDLDGLDKHPSAKSLQKAPKPTVPWWEDDEHGGQEAGKKAAKSRFIKTKTSQPQSDDRQGFGKTFRKSLRKSQSIQEEEEEEEKKDDDPGALKAVEEGLRDSTGVHDTVMNPAVNMGMDTLDEEEEKACFFAQFEANAASSIDYSKLNKEFDSASQTINSDLRKEASAEEREDDDRKAGVTEGVRESPGSLDYSEDFEEEDNRKEKPNKSPILSKVSLYDSLDDFGEEDRKKETAGTLDRGLSYVQSGGSEMDALHEAYRQIHAVQDMDHHNNLFSSVEGREGHRAVSPSSPPQHTNMQSLQPADTTESELPTAEELMRPIKPEEHHTRGFTLQPVRAVESGQESESHLLQRTFPVMTSPESKQEQPGKAKAVGSPTTISPVLSNHNQTWSIRQEVERLMQDQGKRSPGSSQAGRIKKQPVGKGGRAAAATSRLSGLSRTTVPAKGQSSVPQPLLHSQEKAKSTKRQAKDHDTEAGLKASSELVASVQSLVAVLQQQVDTSCHHLAADKQEGRGLQGPWPGHHLPKTSREDSSVVEELRLQLSQKEQDLQVMKEQAQELHSLRQHNFLLQSKLRSAEEAVQKNQRAEASDSSLEEKLQQMEKETKEQEMLIKGYQQENERLYHEMKAQQVRSKSNEKAMFNENEKLLTELAFTRDQLNKTLVPVGNQQLADQTQRFTDLLVQINALQRNEAKLSEEVHRLKQEKQAVEVDLQLVRKERDLAKAQVTSISGDRAFEMQSIVDRHREEVMSLKKKLQWFAENQELLDRDADRQRAAAAEIQQLQEQVKQLKMDVGKRSSEQQKTTKEKTVDTRRMQELERQVKELEHILRNRNPNSLPALIYAAATADHQDCAGATDTSAPSRMTTLLESRIQRLEAELEGRDEEAKRSLRAMEQQFNRVKLRYEEQVSSLEQQLEQKHLEAANSSWRSQVQTLEAELRTVKETHQKKEKSLCDQMESLQEQLKHKAQPSPGRSQRQAQEAFGLRLERMHQELQVKTRSIQELRCTVERLQRERRSMLSVPRLRPEALSSERKQPPAPPKAAPPAPTGETGGGGNMFPTAQCEKTYQPTVFTDSHISEVLQENEALKQHLEELQLQSERDREELKTEAAKAKEELSRLKEDCADQLSLVKAEHIMMLDQLRATHALEHSSSKVAELTNQVNTQQVVVRHLREQLKELQGARDALKISRTREDALQTQLTRLLQELKEAKEAQSPEVKLVCALERKILNMELRHQHREKELQQVIGGSWQTPEADHQEVERWKRVAQEKSKELEVFRLELDSILNILRHLQRQGVVLPAPHHTS